MKLYQFLSGARFLKSYNSKLMFITFLGIHIPLIGIVIALILSPDPSVNKISFFLLTLCLTLLATAVTLLIINALVAPLGKTQRALRKYLEQKAAPGLPENFDDELGRLMHDINRLTAGVKGTYPEIARLQASAAGLLVITRQLQHEKDPALQAEQLRSLEAGINQQVQLLSSMG